MPTSTIFRYPLDPTGESPDNKVTAEPHTLANRPIRAIAPIYGLFFEESIVIRDTANNQILTSSQFRCVELQEVPTARYGKPVCSVILIEDTDVSNDVTVEYQALGGEYSSNTTALVNMIHTLETDNRPTSWPNILNRPAGYDPSPHYHDAGDVYGFEYLIHSLDRIRQAILIGDEAAHDELRRYIDNLFSGTGGDVSAIQAALNNHIGNQSNPHQTNKTHIGLSNVQNFALATTQEAQAGQSNAAYMTPALTAAAITTQMNATVAAVNSHVNNQSNPHQTNKTHIGLSNVQNYPIATTQEAQTGSSNAVYMTPLRVAEAISSLAGNLINSHVNNQSNPHQTNKTHIGLSDVQNYPIATTQEAQAGTQTQRYMTPALTAAAINSLVTATMVGLGNVQNYGIATVAQAQAGTHGTSYMTPLLVREAIAAMLPAAANKAELQVSVPGDVVFSMSTGVYNNVWNNLRRVRVDGQAVLWDSFPTLQFLWCGSTYNNHVDPTQRADFFYRCSNPANPSGSRSDTGSYLVLPPAGYFLRPWNVTGSGADAGRLRWKLQEDEIKAHSHTTSIWSNVGTSNNNPSPVRYTNSDRPAAQYTPWTSSEVGAVENRVKNIPVVIYLVY